MRSDDYKLIKGSVQDGSAEYEYTPNPAGNSYVFRIKDGGTWEPVIKNPDTGRWNKSNGGVFIGRRERYYDPSF